MRIYDQSDLHAHWLKLRDRYLVETMIARLGYPKSLEDTNQLQDAQALRRRICDLLADENSVKFFSRLMKCSGRPYYWFEHSYHWFNACEDVFSDDAVSLVQTCLQPLDWDGIEPDSFLNNVRSLFVSPPSAWRTPNGCILIDEKPETDPVLELSGERGCLFKATSVQDLALISYLLYSWINSTPEISAKARERLATYFWEAWRSHLKFERDHFYQKVFVSEIHMESCHGPSYLPRCRMSLWDSLRPVFEFDDTGLRLVDGMDLSYYASPDLITNSKKLAEWTRSLRDPMYPGFDGDAWTAHGIRAQLDVPLKKGFKLFGSFPDMTLREGLERGMRELDIDQAFFGFYLITRKEYRRRIYCQEYDKE